MPGKRSRQKPRNARRPSARHQRLPASPPGAEAGAAARNLEVPATLLKLMVGAGYIHPTRVNEALCYTSNDLRLLQVARALHTVRISAPKILAALEEIQKILPAEESGNVTVWEAGGEPHQLTS